MSNQISTFNFETNSVRVFLDENNNPLFVAKDVALTLGYSRPNDAINQHCKGAVKHRTLSTKGGKQEMRVIYEPDVYRLIFGSKLENAEKFQNWVFDEVLPSIRKNGSYSSKLTNEQQRELANKVRNVCKGNRKHYSIVWNALKDHFHVERYPEIESADFHEALAIIESIDLPNITDEQSTLSEKQFHRLTRQHYMTSVVIARLRDEYLPFLEKVNPKKREEWNLLLTLLHYDVQDNIIDMPNDKKEIPHFKNFLERAFYCDDHKGRLLDFNNHSLILS